MQWWTLQQLKSKTARTRLAAVRKLTLTPGADLLEVLREMLADADPAVRASVAEALARAQDPKTVSWLGARLPKEPEATVRVEIVKALGALGPEQASPYLVEVLCDTAGEVGWHAARALQLARWQPANGTERAAWHLAVSQFEDALSCGAAAIEPLARLTRSVAFQRCIRAIECLAKLGGSQAVKPLLECLISQDFTIRSAAASALGELGDGRAFDPLVHALRDSHHQVCLAACVSLGKMGDQRAVEPLTKVLRHSAPDVRQAAVNALGKLRDKQAVPGVISLLEDADPDVREAAVSALGLIGSDDAIEPLVLVLADARSSLRQAAAYALRRIEPYWERSEAASRAIPKLQTALKSTDYWVRQSAAEALKKLGVVREQEACLVTDSDGALRKRQAAQAILIDMLAESDREFRQAAAEALGRIGLNEAIPPLVGRLSDLDRGVQAAAARALDSLGWRAARPEEKARQLVALEAWNEVINIGREAIDALVAALSWNDSGVRKRALEALVRIGGPAAVSALRGIAADPGAAAREDALRALSVLGANQTPSVAAARDVWGETAAIA